MSHSSFRRVAVLAFAGLAGIPAFALSATGNPDTDTQNIQAAVAAGGTVTLDPGTYALNGTITIDNGASLVGGGTTREGVVLSLVDGSKTNALKIVDSPNTVVSNLTLTAGNNPHNAIVMNSGLVVDCYIHDFVTENNSTGVGLKPGDTTSGGAAVNMYGGTVRGCRITGCDAQDSSGAGCAGEAIFMQDGLVENCSITGCGNKKGDGGSASWGGAVCIIKKGTLRGCLVADNWNRVGSTGVTVVGPGDTKGDNANCKVLIENCTIVGNRRSTTDSKACGLSALNHFGQSKSCNITLRNNIVWGNTALDGTTETNYNLSNLDMTTCTVEYNNMSPAYALGRENTCVDPMFVNAANGDYHMGYSYCVDAGSAQSWMTDAVDLDGRARVINGTVDKGCYEFDSTGALAARMRLASDGALDLATVSLDCDCSGGAATGASWLFTRQNDHRQVTQTGISNSVNLPVGLWDVKVTVFCDGGYAETEALGALDVRASRVYANVHGSGSFPFDTVAKGAPSVAEAFALVGVGGTLYIAEGSYVIDSPLVIDGTNGSRIESLAGPEKTIIRLDNVAAFNTKLANYGLRVSRNDGYVSGLTLIGGRPSDDYTGAGYATLGLVKVEASGAMVTNCVFRDNMASKVGTGFGNKGPGLHLTAGTVVDSTFTRINHYSAGGAVDYNGVIRIEGGLADRLRITDCWDDSADNIGAGGGGDIVAVVSAGELRNSLVAGCSSVHSSMVYAGVTMGANPAVDHGGSVVNCTIVANTNTMMKAGDDGSSQHINYHHEAGVFVNGGTLVNSIVADNYSAYAEGILNLDDSQGVDAGITYTLVNGTAEEGFATEANHNVVVPADRAIFHKPEQGDYTLQSGSAAVNAAQKLAWMETGFDLAGNARIINRFPDMGCYESRPKGLAIRLR